MQICVCPALQILKLLDYIVFAGLREIESGGIPVGLLVLSKVIEAAVTIPRSARGFGVDLLQVLQDLSPRAVQTVEVQAIEPHLWRMLGSGIVIIAKPSNE